jgi:tRNA (guanosine-2'-O-)-methyltransferase
VIIPMSGMGTSLNVSVAAALLLFEAQRQRLAAGFYDRPRLDPETYRTMLFEWAFPKLAALCRKRGFPYPPLDEDGEILGPLPR